MGLFWCEYFLAKLKQEDGGKREGEGIEEEEGEDERRGQAGKREKEELAMRQVLHTTTQST